MTFHTLNDIDSILFGIITWHFLGIFNRVIALG